MCVAGDSVTISTTSVEIVAQNSQRTGLFIRNLSVNTVSLGFGNNAVNNKGVVLLANECFSMSRFDMSTDPVNAISTAPGTLIAIQEFGAEVIG